jgi:hypothetical protein
MLAAPRILALVQGTNHAALSFARRWDPIRALYTARFVPRALILQYYSFTACSKSFGYVFNPNVASAACACSYTTVSHALRVATIMLAHWV